MSYNNEFTKGELVEGFESFEVNKIEEGILRIEGFSTEPISAGSTGVLAQIMFKVNQCEKATLIFDKFLNRFAEL